MKPVRPQFGVSSFCESNIKSILEDNSNAMQSKVKPCKAKCRKLCVTLLCVTKQCEAEQCKKKTKANQCKGKQSNAKQCKAMQSKSKHILHVCSPTHKGCAASTFAAASPWPRALALKGKSVLTLRTRNFQAPICSGPLSAAHWQEDEQGTPI